MTPDDEIELLRRAGAALHGPHWISPLAREEGKGLRTVQRWVNGSFQIDPELWPSLLRQIRERRAELVEVEGELETLVSRQARPPG